MPSPFPGMDPFLESQGWSDFHTRLIAEVSNTLVSGIRPRYEVKVERRVYIETAQEVPDDPRSTVPDLMITTPTRSRRPLGGTAVVAPGVTIEPMVIDMPWSEESREAYLKIRDTLSHRIVAIIEVLSPSNKRRGTTGRRQYLSKRKAVLESTAHFVEIDLLRGGKRMPFVERNPHGDYFAMVSHAGRPVRRATVYAWPMAHILPSIPIPLDPDVPDVWLDLQAVFTTVYDRAGYDYTVRYNRPVRPALSAAEVEWVAGNLPNVTPDAS